MPHLFIDDESWERALLLWEKLAGRYKDRWIVGGYDLLNEPVSLPNHRYCVPKLAKFYDEAIARIRAIDQVHMFTLEGSCFSRSNEIFDHDFDPLYHNWCIHIHVYEPSPERKVLYPYLLKGMEYQVPVWIGEGGATPVNNAVFYQAASEYGIGFCLWCWKVAIDGADFRAVGYHLPKDWELVRTYCAGGPKPSYEKCIAIFDELLENIKYENCVHNKEIMRISRRIAPLELPAVGYDNRRDAYCSTWEYGNLLDYRLEDHTKMVWTRGMEEPRPGFDMYEDENIQLPMDPLECLMLELNAGEHAVYTVYEVMEGSSVKLYGQSPDHAVVLIYANQTLIGEIAMGDELTTYAQDIQLPEADEIRIMLRVKSGCARIKTLKIGADD